MNIDLLYDVPGQSLASWIDSLEFVPDHLSLYALTLDDPDAEGLTGPTRQPPCRPRPGVREAAAAELRTRCAAAEYHYAVHRLGDEGWRGYEEFRLGAAGPRSVATTSPAGSDDPYEAVGRGRTRSTAPLSSRKRPRLDVYLAALAPGGAPRPRRAANGLDPATARAEELILGLRTDRGIPLDTVASDPAASVFGWALANELVATGDDERIRLTTRGRLLSNEVFARLGLIGGAPRRRRQARRAALTLATAGCYHALSIVSTHTWRVLTRRRTALARRIRRTTGPLDERTQAILRAVIEEYVTTATPVGSHALVERYGLTVSSATVRGILHELETLGMLAQPHTSAGRVPTDAGYRYYVESIMESSRSRPSSS